MYNGAGQVSVYEESACLPTFAATFSNISNTVVSGTSMGYASLWHTASSTKRIRLWKVWMTIKSVATLGNFTASLKRWNTTAPAGGTAITPAPADPTDTVDTYTVFQTNNTDPWSGSASPTFASTCADVAYYWRNAAFTTGSSGAAPAWGANVVLYEYRPSVAKPLILRPATLEGIMLTLDTDVASSVVVVGGGFQWTEE